MHFILFSEELLFLEEMMLIKYVSTSKLYMIYIYIYIFDIVNPKQIEK